MITVLIAVIVAVFIGLLVHLILCRILEPIFKRTSSKLDDYLLKYWKMPARWIIPASAIMFTLPLFTANQPKMVATLQHVFSLLLIGCVAWLLIRTTRALEDYVLERFDVSAKDNLKARAIHTQFRLFKRIVIVIVVVLTLALMLMTFAQVRHIGTSILASAGILGLIVGFAAQKSLATVLAGIQIAITQPIRIDDVVIVENEWGRIEEITLTYVVVRIWDLRRLVLPITYFIEKPFQNWTRVTADILGTVYLYTDYTVPTEAIRAELQRIVKSCSQWDGKVCGLQVTDATERAVQLRALVSAADASAAWNLRCYVREKLVEFIQKQYPQALPRTRAEFHQLKDEESAK